MKIILIPVVLFGTLAATFYVAAKAISDGEILITSNWRIRGPRARLLGVILGALGIILTAAIIGMFAYIADSAR